MPHCILVLRLIGIVYDLYDGHQPQETLSASNKLVALVRRPTILEIYGHTLFPAAFLVGPQFPMKRYLDFVTRVYSNPVSVKKRAICNNTNYSNCRRRPERHQTASNQQLDDFCWVLFI